MPNVANKVVLVELMSRRQMVVNAAAVWSDVLAGETLKNIGPNVESMRVYAYGEDFPAGFQYRVKGQYSYDGNSWTDFNSEILAGTSTLGNVVGSVYSTTSDFGLWLRFKVGSYATSVGTGGTVSITLALTMKS